MIKSLILVGGKEKYHDLLFAGQTLQKILIEHDIVASYSQDFSILYDKKINSYDVIIFYTQNKQLSLDEQKGLKNYIQNGKLFIALHSANVYDLKKNNIYKNIVGSKFIHHDPFKRFQVITDNEHYITASIDDFEIDDELYISEFFYEPDNILAWAIQDGKKQPLLYLKKLGKGKVCYFALGHDGRSWNHPSFKKILCRTILWSADN